MRLLRLALRRYGHLADTVLDFDPGAALHVVHGRNEAGKSTTLQAIADALFGFGHQTPYDFRFPGPQLRLAFDVAGQDGTTASFIRTKGRKDTLRDPLDTPIPEDALRRFLGGATRELFEKGHGLDGERLRKGGLELLTSGGDAGESLLAGSGIANLRGVMARLESEEKSLVGDGRGTRRLSAAVKAWRAAQDEADRRSVLPRDWKMMEETRANAEAALARIRADAQVLTVEQSRLQRARRVLPVLRGLDELRAVLGRLGDGPPLPPDIEEQQRGAIAQRDTALRDAEREVLTLAALTQRLEALPLDPAVIAQQDRIDHLAEERGIIAQALSDLPAIRARVSGFAADTEQALREIGGTLAPAAARDAMPPNGVQAAIRRLIQQRAKLAAELAASCDAEAQAMRRRDALRQRLAASPPVEAPLSLRRTLDAVRAEGPIDSELARAEAALVTASAAAETALAALPLWEGTLEALATCPVPLAADAEAVAARIDTAERHMAELRAVLVRLDGESVSLRQEILRLAHGEPVPTRAAIAERRGLRDRAWRLIRRRYAGGPEADAEERRGLPDGALAEVFETLFHESDALADRAFSEAKRVADYLAAEARLAALDAQRAEQARLLQNAEASSRAETEVWNALWAPCGIAPSGPPAMLEWRRQRAAVLDLAKKQADAMQQCSVLRRRHALALERLAEVPGGSVAARLHQAEEVLAATEAEFAGYTRLVDAQRQEEERLPLLADAVAKAQSVLDAWRQDWSRAAAAMGLAADVTTDAAEIALEAWGRIAKHATAWREDATRIADIETRVDRAAAELAAVRAALGEADVHEDIVLGIPRLARRLASARKAADEAMSIAAQIQQHRDAQARARASHAQAVAACDALCALAGVADPADLAQIIADALSRETLAAQIRKTESDLRAQGDGLSEAALRAETDGFDIDLSKARLDEIAQALESFGPRREALSAARSDAETRLAQMRDGQDAAAYAQAAEDALAEARDAAERYARVHVARVLLQAGIERYRRENQGPLLRAAGENFALLTENRYRRLSVDEDDAGRPVLRAQRADGTECPVHSLSEGTRDQLFLALRVATLQSTPDTAERLPFIADDLLVHFDDPRAQTGLTLLARLGQTHQVILFTHHDHIVTLAHHQPNTTVTTLPAAV